MRYVNIKRKCAFHDASLDSKRQCYFHIISEHRFFEAVYLPNEDSIDFAETILDIILGLAIVIGGTGFGMYLVHFHKEWSDTANKLTGPSIVAMLIIAVVGKRALGSLK